MQIQSLSIVVPNKGCINKCPFCVSRMVNSNQYENLMDINHPCYDINVREYLKRMHFVADNGCQTIMLTGTSEPQQNKQFLATLALLHQQIGSPFSNIEMQTTGFGLDKNRNYIRFLRNFVGVNTIALSINALDDVENSKVLGQKLTVLSSAETETHAEVEAPLDISYLCDILKEYDFNIRCCFNLTDRFNDNTVEDVFEAAKNRFHADQVTFRKLYASDENTEQGQWIKEHQIALNFTHALKEFLDSKTTTGTTAYGATCHDVDGMSVIYDTDCMGKNPETDVKKFLILRPNCKLYSQWDSPASLVF